MKTSRAGRPTITLAIACCSSFLSQGAAAQGRATDTSAVELQEVVVTGRNFRPNTNATSTKFDRPLAETPQSITVLDANVFDAVGIDDYVEAVALIPGAINAGSFGGTVNIASRGYSVGGANSFKVNGIPVFGRPIDNIAVQSLEFVKGGSGTTFGEGNPGGFINLISRRPSEESEAEFSASAGSWDQLRASARLSGQVMDAGDTRGLISVAGQQSDAFVNFEERDSLAFFTSLTSDPSDSVSMELNAYYSEAEYDHYNNGWPAVFRTDELGNLVSTEFAVDAPWKLNTGQSWNNSDENYMFVNGRVDLRLNERATLSAIAGYNEFDLILSLFDICCSVDPDDYTSNGFSFYANYRIDTTFAELRLTGDFDIGSAPTQYLVSGEYRRRVQKEGFSDYNLVAPGFELLNPQYDFPDPFVGLSEDDIITFGSWRIVDVYSISGTTVTDIGPWSITLGARYDDFEPFNRSYLGNFETEFQREKFPSSNTALRAAVMYDIGEGGHLYASYGETFEINNGRTCSGSVLPPETGEIMEIGYKQELNNRKLLLTTALYDIETVGNTVPVPLLECPGAGDQSVEAGDGTASEGFEIELVGRVTDNINVVGGYAYNDTVVRAPDGDRPAANIAPHQASLFVTYDFLEDSALRGFGFSLGGTYAGSRVANAGETPAERLHLDSRVRADAAIYYDSNERYSLSLHVKNIFDEQDPLVPFSTTEFQHMWMESRSVLFTVDVRL